MKYGSDIESDAGSEKDDLLVRTPNEGNIKIYTEILGFLKHGETVAKALKVGCHFLGLFYKYCLCKVYL